MKTRQEINRENYRRSQAKRQDKARERMRQIRADWRTDLAAWDRSNELTEIPELALAASGLSEWSARSALGLIEVDEWE